MRSHPILRGYIAVLLCSLIACLPASAATVDYKEGTKVNFAPSATVAGINVGSKAADPSAPVNGDIWYKTGTGFRIRSEGTTLTLGAGGSGTGDALTTNPLSQFAATTSAQLRGVISDESGTGALIFAGGALGAATATTLNGLTVTTTTGTLTLANGKTLTASNTLTLAGTDGSTLNIGAGGTLGAAALLGTSAGGNGTADNGKAAIFGTGGIFDVTTELTVHNSSNAAHAYLSDDGTIGFHAVGETNPRELAFPSDVLEGESKEIATKNWVNAQGFGSGSVATDAIWAAAGDLVYATGNNTAAILPIGATPGYALLTSAGFLPEWGAVALPGSVNTFTAQQTFSKLPEVSRTNLSSGTALSVGVAYYDSISANRTLTFSGTPAAGSVISLKLVVTNSPVITLPASPAIKRAGEGDTAVTSLQLSAGVHILTFTYINSEWILNDTVGTPSASQGFAADAGANDTYTATLTLPISSYTTGMHYRFKAATANTGAATINFNGAGAVTIKKAAGGITTDLADNDIRAGQWVDLVYDGTNMQMQSLLGNTSSGSGDFVGPGSSTDNAIVRFDSTTGKLGQNSTVTIDDTGAVTVPEMAAPATPGSGKVSLYAKSDGLLYSKDDAGTETVVTGGGGGSGPPTVTTQRTTVNVWDEFFWGANASATVGTGPFGMVLAQSGTGVAAGNGNVSTTDCPGILQLENGTGAANYSGLIASAGGIRFGGCAYTIEWRVRVPTLTDGTDNFTVRCGFIDSSTGTDGTDGVFFRYSNASANWVFVTRDNSTETATTSTTAVVANTWYKLRAAVNAAGTSVTYTINDADSTAITTNIPTGSTRILGIGANIIRDAGTTERTFQLDYCGLDFTLSASR